MITTCPVCGNLYEAESEEAANEPTRMCRSCIDNLADQHEAACYEDEGEAAYGRED